MKKTISMILILIICLLFTGCSENKPQEDEPQVTEKVDNNQVEVKTDVLLSPVMEWWQIFNPNGFDTFTALITNPNDKTIDVSYDLVYYKDGKEVARNEYFANYNILPNHQDIIWANYDILKADEVDEVKMENVVVTEATTSPIDGTFELDGIGTRGELYYLALLDKEPTYMSAWFVFYTDENNNDKFDKGEIHYVENKGYELEDKWIVVEPLDFNYTDVDVYFTAY